MPMNTNILGCSTSPLEPSLEELEKISELKALLKEHLANTSISEVVRQALASYIGDQQFLIKYVRGRKLNVKKALHSLITYAEVKFIKYPELFPSKVPDYVQYALDCGVITVLNQRDSLGRTIVLATAELWDESKMSLEEAICVGRYVCDALMNNAEFLKDGVILTIDCRGVTLSHLKQFTLPTVIKFINLYWQAYPILIKGIYAVNTPMVVRPLYALVKPFVPVKLKERILIASGVSEFHKKVSSDILPERLGGKLPDDKVQSQSIKNYFTELSC